MRPLAYTPKQLYVEYVKKRAEASVEVHKLLRDLRSPHGFAHEISSLETTSALNLDHFTQRSHHSLLVGPTPTPQRSDCFYYFCI